MRSVKGIETFPSGINVRATLSESPPRVGAGA
jgi:hypothetical protein